MADPAVRMTSVRLAYGAQVVLEDLDLQLPAAAVTALIGPNGSGKTTVLHAVGGLLSPTAGAVTVRGRPPAQARREVAYVLQSTEANRLLPVTAGEVVRMGRYGARGMFRPLGGADRQAVAQAMARMDVTDLAGRHLRELSGGQRQRVLVAQGLAQEAPVLLLDEPVSGLDLVSQQLIAEAIRDERDAGRTVLVTTHDLRDAWRADHVVLLAGGVVAAGPPAEVLTTPHLRRAYGGQLVSLGLGAALDDTHDHSHAGSEPPVP